VGVLAAGRLIDKLGTRVGYCVFMGIWSLSAMGHALASSALEFGFARFFLGLGESGNFPGGDQDGRRVVSAEGAVAGDGDF
jgi:ACS family hexuronate transporter-like MFS transporter